MKARRDCTPIENQGPCGAAIEPGVAGRTAFTLRVQTGCAEPCSYCIIPMTRGRSRSAAIGAVLGEVARAADAGFKEIALTGVHLGSYGRDLAPAASLIDLLRALDALPHDVRFRISSLEPMDCSPGDRRSGRRQRAVRCRIFICRCSMPATGC